MDAKVIDTDERRKDDMTRTAWSGASPARRTLVGLAALIAPLAGCNDWISGLDYALLGDDDLVFITLPAEPNGHMQALFRGVVVIDAAGCFRLDLAAPDNSTVVWPFGATLRPGAGGWTVHEASGRAIGRIGETMTFGGGHVPSLHSGLQFSGSDRTILEARCPGSFWIVGEIPAS